MAAKAPGDADFAGMLLVLSIVLDAVGRPLDKALVWVLGGMILAKLVWLIIERIPNYQNGTEGVPGMQQRMWRH